MALRIDSSQNRNLYVGTGTEVAVNDGNAIVTGNVGIGVTGPNAKLELSQTTTGVGAIIANSTHNSQLLIYTAAANKNSELWFGDAADPDVGKIDYDHANDSMSFFIGATKRLSFDSAGTMLLGDTTTAYQTIFFDPTPSTVYGNGTLQIQPTTSPGSGIAQFTTNFADRVGGGTTKHNVRVGGTVTATNFIGTLPLGQFLPLAGGTMDASANINMNSGTLSSVDSIDFGIGQLNGVSTSNLILKSLGDITYNVDSNNNGNSSHIFQESGSELMRIRYDGNVGIGTTSPSTTLQLTKANTEVLANQPAWPTGILEITDTSAYNAGTGATIVFRKKRDSTGNQVTVGAIAGEGVAGDSRLSFWTGTAAYMGTAPKMVIDDSGNVGIGTTSPDSKLQVNVGTDQNVAINSSVGVARISSYNDGATLSTPLKINGSELRFDISNTEKMRINSSGNVGIGTTSPSAKLSVIGDIDFGGGNNDGIIEVSGSGDLIFKYKGSDPALTLDGGAVKTIVHNRLDALNIVNINNPSNNESILNIQDDGTNGHIAFENSSEITGIIASDTEVINFRVGDGVSMSDSPVLTLLPSRIGINTTSPNSNVALDIDGRVLIKDSTGVADFYLGNYATANHFRFHTNNANTYFDMNCGDIYWRDGASTRYTFFPSTANMTINGTLTQNSDARVKENIVEISDCISKVQAMKGVYYNRTDFNTETKKVGVIAQDVEAVLPELIIESPEDGLKSVAYSELTAVLINAIKEQQEIIEDLKTRITKLEN